MIRARTDYSLVDVSNVPTITGDILPVRDNTARMWNVRMEDLAFLAEGLRERGVIRAQDLSWSTSHVCAQQVWRARDWQQTLGTWRYDSLAYSSLICNELGGHYIHPDAEFPAAWTWPHNVTAGIANPLRYLSEVHSEWLFKANVRESSAADFFAPPSLNALRRAFYDLKRMKRVVSSSWANRANDFWWSGTVGFTASPPETRTSYTNLRGDDIIGGGWSTIHGWPYIQGSGELDGYTIFYTATDLSAVTFKTRIAFANLRVFFVFYVHAVGDAFEPEPTEFGTHAQIMLPITATNPTPLTNDPEGYVQSWTLPVTQLTYSAVKATAESFGFKFPETGGGIGYGIGVESYIGGFETSPLFRTEIDSTGWNWSPPAG